MTLEPYETRRWGHCGPFFQFQRNEQKRKGHRRRNRELGITWDNNVNGFCNLRRNQDDSLKTLSSSLPTWPRKKCQPFAPNPPGRRRPNSLTFPLFILFFHLFIYFSFPFAFNSVMEWSGVLLRVRHRLLSWFNSNAFIEFNIARSCTGSRGHVLLYLLIITYNHYLWIQFNRWITIYD